MTPDIVEAIAYKVIYVKKGSKPTEEDESDYVRLSYQICNWSIVVLVLVIGIVTGRFIESLFAVCSFWTVRMLTGGIHLPSLTMCVLASVILLTGASLINLGTAPMIFTCAISSVLILSYREKQRSILLRRWDVILGLMVTISGLMIAPGTIVIAVFAQSLTLLGRR